MTSRWEKLQLKSELRVEVVRLLFRLGDHQRGYLGMPVPKDYVIQIAEMPLCSIAHPTESNLDLPQVYGTQRSALVIKTALHEWSQKDHAIC